MKDITPFVKNYRALASRLWNEWVRGHGGFLSEWDDCDEAEDRCVELFRREVLDPVDPTLPDKTPEYMASKDPNPRLAVVPAGGARVQIGGLDGRQDPVFDRLDPALVPRTAFLFVTLFDFEIRGERTFDYCWTRIADCPDASLVGRSALIPFEFCTFAAMDEGDTPQDAGVVNGINSVPYLVGGGIGLLILILLVRPAGLFGVDVQEKA